LAAEFAACVIAASFVVPLVVQRREGAALVRKPQPAARPAKRPADGGDSLSTDLPLGPGSGRLTVGFLPVMEGRPAKPVPPPAPPPTFRPSIPRHLRRKGLMAVWLADGNAFDSAGSHHGAATVPGYTADRHGTPKGAFRFDGRSGLVVVPGQATLNSDEAFTVSLWINPRLHGGRGGGQSYILARWGHYLLPLGSDGHLAFWVGDCIHTDEGLRSKSVIPVGQWTHVGATFDRGRIRLYINGRLDGENVAANIRHTSRMEASHDHITIGAKRGGGYSFCGAVDEVAIWNRALAGDEIAAVSRLAAAAAPYVSRLASADRVLLADGRELLGTLRNEGFRLAACFGEIELAAQRVAGFAATGKQAHPIAVLLTDGQVLVGTLAEKAALLKLSTGSTLRMPVELIRQCGYRISEAKPAVPAPPRPSVALRKGDRLGFSGADLKLRLRPEALPTGLDLPAGSVLRVNAADPNGRGHRVTFVNGSALTGRLLPEELSLKLKLGRTLTLRWEAVRQLVLGTRPVLPAGRATMVLRNDDRLIGRLIDEKVTVRTPFGPAEVAAASVSRIAFDANDPNVVALTQWDGVVLEGHLAEPALTVALAPGGPEVRVPAARIAAVHRSVALPSPEMLQRIQSLIARLGAESHKDRDAATRALVALGPKILPLLREHRASRDPEVRQRIGEILQQLGADVGADQASGR